MSLSSQHCMVDGAVLSRNISYYLQKIVSAQSICVRSDSLVLYQMGKSTHVNISSMPNMAFVQHFTDDTEPFFRPIDPSASSVCCF